jgi:hypothetical protein
MVQDYIFLQMGIFIKVNLKMEIDKAKEATHGQIKATIKVNG